MGFLLLSLIFFIFYFFSFQGGIHGTPYEKYNRHQSGSDASMRMQRQHGSHSGKPRSSPAQSSRNARCQIDIQALKNQTEIRTTVMVSNIHKRRKRASRIWKHCSFDLYYSFLFQTCFIVFATFSSI